MEIKADRHISLTRINVIAVLYIYSDKSILWWYLECVFD